MRKIFNVLLIFVLVVSFSACGSAPAPKDIAEKFLVALKAKDAEGIREVYDGSYSEDELIGTVESLLGESGEGEADDEATKQFEEKLLDFDYTIGEERVDGENAEVDVTFKTYDFGTMIGRYLEQAFTELISASFSGASEEELDAIGTRILSEELTALTEKTYEKTVPMKLTKVEDGWKVAQIEDDSEFLNAMLGGMIDIIKGFDELGDSLNRDEKEEEAASGAVGTETTKESADTSAFDSFTAIDNEKCSVAICGIDPNGPWGYEIQVALENKSPDKTYVFSVEAAAINGVETDPAFAKKVNPGKKASESINLSDMSEYGIVDYTDIELFFRIYNADDWTEEPVVNESFHVYPYGEDKAESFTRESAPTDRVLVENQYAAVIVTGVRMDEIWGYTLDLYLQNKTDRNVMFTILDASVNDYMVDPFFATVVKARKQEFTTVSWPKDALDENGITEVTDLEFTLRAYDENDWSLACIYEKISLQP